MLPASVLADTDRQLSDMHARDDNRRTGLDAVVEQLIDLPLDPFPAIFRVVSVVSQDQGLAVVAGFGQRFVIADSYCACSPVVGLWMESADVQVLAEGGRCTFTLDLKTGFGQPGVEFVGCCPDSGRLSPRLGCLLRRPIP